MWDDLVAWFQSPGGARVLQTAIVPALAILVAGVLAALIARAAVRAVIRRSERAEAASAVAALVASARAAADPNADRGARRRAARLRTEADVRTRLLPLKGADTAADWAADRIDQVQRLAGQRPVDGDLDELRDRLVEWVARPARAKRVFTAAAPRTEPATTTAPPTPAARAPQKVEAAPAAAAPEPAPAAEAERFARPAEAPTARAPREPDPQSAAEAASPAAEPPVRPAPAVAVATGQVPAWQRTRAGERLQQEHGRARTPEETTGAEDASTSGPVTEGTAPVQIAHAHRAPEAQGESDDGVRLEAHQQARHARPERSAAATPDAAAPVTAGAPAAPAPATPAPAWLDVYDDEAHVTQNLDLKTPPPVSASSVRDRGTPGEDLVPRS